MTAAARKNYVNGEWVGAASQRTRERNNPADIREVVAVIADSAAEDVRAAVDSVAAGYREWAERGPEARADVLHRAADILADRADELARELVREEGKRQKVNEATLNACIAKQDDSAVRASIALGSKLNVSATPALFVNGELFEGALPIEYLYRMIDNALIAEGKTPPPPVPLPSLNNATPSESGESVDHKPGE